MRTPTAARVITLVADRYEPVDLQRHRLAASWRRHAAVRAGGHMAVGDVYRGGVTVVTADA